MLGFVVMIQGVLVVSVLISYRVQEAHSCFVSIIVQCVIAIYYLLPFCAEVTTREKENSDTASDRSVHSDESPLATKSRKRRHGGDEFETLSDTTDVQLAKQSGSYGVRKRRAPLFSPRRQERNGRLVIRLHGLVVGRFPSICPAVLTISAVVASRLLHSFSWRI